MAFGILDYDPLVIIAALRAYTSNPSSYRAGWSADHTMSWLLDEIEAHQGRQPLGNLPGGYTPEDFDALAALEEVGIPSREDLEPKN